MTDAELTRLAFKAAFGGADIQQDKDMLKRWSPLTSNADAFWLAVQLRLDVHIDSKMTEVVYLNKTKEAHMGEPCAATRRAIVRAAADIANIVLKLTPLIDE